MPSCVENKESTLNRGHATRFFPIDSCLMDDFWILEHVDAVEFRVGQRMHVLKFKPG